ncbi:phage portal protein [Anaerococcus tetradius]|uniref:Phage portal protein n=1 Tax=Anaerococcus tetradius ATCC 35098 TaxID=525255 RepID=C2CHM2_9FIRM|nr:phage portal protein [Anaerococcus tetradius]EEI82977.1 hypothetical protein HMPREF0077_0982 [Anaerococcus tetradius ATCC 35098]
MEYGLDYLRRKLDKYALRVNLRYDHYDEKKQDRDVGIVIPQEIRSMYRAVIGWCTKSVDTLADRLVFKGFVDDDFGIGEIFNLNNPDIFFDSAILSALIGSCCFVYISKAETGEARLQVIEASNATGIIDPITGLLTEGYAVLDRDDYNKAKSEAYFSPHFTDYYMDGKFSYRIDNPTGRALLVPIIYRPDAVRPFGRSRISRAAMYYQAHAKRTLERADISAEFYSFPQKYIVGTSQDKEPMDNLKATIASILEITKDDEGGIPKLGQFQQQSMSPFTEQLRTLASGFAGETGLTLDDLGFVTDNPSSAEAIKASHETLRITARKAQRCFGTGFLNVGYVARCLEDSFPYRRNQFYKTKLSWYPVFEPDVAALSGIGDASIKINQAIPGFLGKDNLSDLTGFDASKEAPRVEVKDE